MNIRLTPIQLAAYEQARNDAALISLPTQTTIDLTGNDRQKFIHNLCTNEVNSLGAGRGCEAFFCNVQGKILAHAFLLSGESSLRIVTVPGQSQQLLTHLDKYLIADDVTLNDASDATASWLFVGPQAATHLEALHLPVPEHRRLDHIALPEDNLIAAGMRCIRVDMIEEPSFLLQTAAVQTSDIESAFADRGFKVAGEPLFQVLRAEAGFPLFGIDIDDSHLPQEVARDEQTISFVKGCYLGQETVARIDALGHVNWRLARVAIDGEAFPAEPADLHCEDRVVGRLSTIVDSPSRQALVGLARIRREYPKTGTPLKLTDGRTVSVVD